MKQVITAVALAVMLLNLSLAADGVDKISPAPEVIKCEATESCEMTKIETLPEAVPETKKHKKADKK